MPELSTAPADASPARTDKLLTLSFEHVTIADALGLAEAADASYDNAASGLAATNVQSAIDEIAGGGGGSGDVVGPVSSVDGHVALFDGTSGKSLKDGGVPAVDRSTVTAVTPSSGAATFDYSLGDYFTLAPTANVTALAFSSLPGSGHGATLMIRFTQDSTARTVTWPPSFKWAGGTAPAVSTAPGAIDLLAVTTFDNGTTWRATLAKAWA